MSTPLVRRPWTGRDSYVVTASRRRTARDPGADSWPATGPRQQHGTALHDTARHGTARHRGPAPFPVWELMAPWTFNRARAVAARRQELTATLAGPAVYEMRSCNDVPTI